MRRRHALLMIPALLLASAAVTLPFPARGRAQDPVEPRRLDWERLNSSLPTYRARLPGGWLVRTQESSSNPRSGGLTYVPDPAHTWDGGSSE